MAAKKVETPEFLSTGQVAKLTGLSRETIRKAIVSGELRSKKYGDMYMIEFSAYQEWKARVFRDVAL